MLYAGGRDNSIKCLPHAHAAAWQGSGLQAECFVRGDDVVSVERPNTPRVSWRSGSWLSPAIFGLPSRCSGIRALIIVASMRMMPKTCQENLQLIEQKCLYVSLPSHQMYYSQVTKVMI